MAEEKETTKETTEATDAVKETKEDAVADTPAEEAVKEPTEATEPAAPEAPKGTDAPIPDEYKDIIEKIETMSVLELHKLVKVLEERFGVSAAAVAVATTGAGGGEEAEEKTTATVELKSFGDQKIPVIKVVKEALGLGLKEAKDLVESAPTQLGIEMKKEEAEELKAKLEGAGGTVELK
jgi:large subunit ribosomal protein L7/L12